MADEQKALEFKVDRQNLYREESVTDLKMATIRRLVPIKDDGSPDKTRKEVFVGQTSILTPNGPLPIQAEIKAKNFQQAFKLFPESMNQAVEKLAEEVQRIQKEQESRIVVPGRSASQPMGPKIQL